MSIDFKTIDKNKKVVGILFLNYFFIGVIAIILKSYTILFIASAVLVFGTLALAWSKIK